MLEKSMLGLDMSFWGQSVDDEEIFAREFKQENIMDLNKINDNKLILFLRLKSHEIESIS